MDDIAWSPNRAQDGTGFRIASDRVLFVTRDNGQSWERAFAVVPDAASLPVTAVAVSPGFVQDGLVAAAIPGGTGCSHDRGDTWVFAPLPGHLPLVTCLAIVPDSDVPLLLAGTLEDGVARSVNGGKSWSFWNGGLFDREVTDLEWNGDAEPIVAITPSGPYTSRNGGRSWRSEDHP
ncbi:MAG: hypothetical protein QM589_04805 [Thermomicrobiales bacterium]